jgi:hypothetical protein
LEKDGKVLMYFLAQQVLSLNGEERIQRLIPGGSRVIPDPPGV